ncbi:MAG: S8 family peptidase [bacterium]|nr:S8 family peptidase [bacterium]
MNRIILVLSLLFSLAALTVAVELPATLLTALEKNGEPLPVWVFLPERLPASVAEQNAFQALPSETQFRRLLNGSRPDAADLAVDPIWIQKITATGATLRNVSRYLHAVSVTATRKQLEAIAGIEGVRKIQPVAVGRSTAKFSPEKIRVNPNTDEVDTLNYGNSRSQITQIRAHVLHNQGYTGRGVLGGILDTGFRWYHDSFDSLTVHAQRDFIFHDSETANEPADTIAQWEHGTSCASTIAGYTSGRLIGPSYKMNLILGKTENVRGENPIEEDNYVAGIEWCDSLGARGVSTSLGYIDWYQWEDMNGDTALCTQVVDRAAARGMLVITAAGNENGNSWGRIIAPADADSTLSVAAVDSNGVVAGFSSRGPSYDGRMKPEVAARGVRTYCANPEEDNTYWRLSGTSLATPLVAGATFLLWEKHPYWTAMTMRRALMETASQHAQPDTILGWGIINVAAADTFTFGGNRPPVIDSARLFTSDYSAYEFYAHDPDGDALFYDLWYHLGGVETHYGLLSESTGQLIGAIVLDSFRLVVTDRYYATTFIGVAGVTAAPEPIVQLPTTLSLTASPNPFNSSTTVRFSVPRAGSASLTIFDAIGREVYNNVYPQLLAGVYREEITQNQLNASASGILFVRLQTANQAITKKLIYLR